MSKLPTIELRWRRGSYCGEITGADKRYGLALDWQDATTVKRDGGRLIYALRPGYYQTGEWDRDAKTRIKKHWRVTAATIELLPDGLDYAAIAEGPKPNEPGSFGDSRCHCGADVARYDANGLPSCETHTAVIDETMPNPCEVAA